jgi:hypothetical protein
VRRADEVHEARVDGVAGRADDHVHGRIRGGGRREARVGVGRDDACDGGTGGPACLGQGMSARFQRERRDGYRSDAVVCRYDTLHEIEHAGTVSGWRPMR